MHENWHVRVQLRLVRSHPRSHQFDEMFSASHAVYHKYQTTIHDDPPSKPNQRQYTNFLVDSPLVEVALSAHITASVLCFCDCR